MDRESTAWATQGKARDILDYMLRKKWDSLTYMEEKEGWVAQPVTSSLPVAKADPEFSPITAGSPTYPST